MAAPQWQQSSYCGEGEACIGLATAEDGSIRIRESSAPETVVTTTPDKFRAFILGVKAGEFDAYVEQAS
jgi:hypothetical protein